MHCQVFFNPLIKKRDDNFSIEINSHKSHKIIFFSKNVKKMYELSLTCYICMRSELRISIYVLCYEKITTVFSMCFSFLNLYHFFFLLRQGLCFQRIVAFICHRSSEWNLSAWLRKNPMLFFFFLLNQKQIIFFVIFPHNRMKVMEEKKKCQE